MIRRKLRHGIVAALLLAGVLLAPSARGACSPVRLRCEWAAAPFGVDAAQPRLFWECAGTGRGERLTAYQVLAASSEKNLAHDRGDLWDSGKVASDETIHLAYAGRELKTSQRVFWKVRVWDEDGKVSAWSQPAKWTMGVLSVADWQAQWISAADTNAATLLLRRDFVVKPGLTRALLHVCGLGQYEFSLNGKKVGDDFLAPGWTKYDKTCLYDTHEITADLRRGPNAAGIFLGPGMYHVVGVSNRFTKFKGSFGPLQTIAQIRLEYADGSVEILGTDESWRVAPGPVTFCSIYGGEDCDARLAPRGWDCAGFDASQWPVARITGGPGGALRGQSCAAPPIRSFEIHQPVGTRTLTNGDVVFDLGQNAAHRLRLRVGGPAGSRVRLWPAELVNADGSVNQGSMGAGRRGAVWCEFTKATDGLESWSPSFFYVGCRYVQAHGEPMMQRVSSTANRSLAAAPAESSGVAPGAARPAIKSLEGIVVQSASEPVGEFACSNPLFNRIRNLVRWAQRSNMMSLLTDCPHRERLGWLEEDHLNGPSLRYEFALDQLFTKMMNDITDSQLPGGLVPTTAPEYTIFRDKNDPNHLRNHFGESPEWGSSSLIVPWQQYEFAADRDMLRRNYDVMKRYVAYLGSRATNHLVAHGLGDWYDVGPRGPGVSQLTPVALSATAFYFYDTWILAQTAALLDKPAEAKEFSDQAEAIRAVFNTTFFDSKKKSYATGSQYANAVALVMNLCAPEQRDAVLDAIVRDVRAHGNALTAGDVGYRYLLRALADGGRNDVIFEMNNQTNQPGYGMQLAKGKTSLTEAWDGGSSQNHFMLGQIEEWFYHDVAGIRSDPAGPGFKKIILAPQPVGDLTWAKASYHSILGEIISDWTRAGEKFKLRVTIPANTTATVFVPAKPGSAVTENGQPAGRSRGVKWLRQEKDRAIFAVESGTYDFETK